MSEYIFGQQSQESESDAPPAYMIAANSHNTGNLNADWFEGAQPKRTIAERSLTALYPWETSAEDRGVPQRGQYGTILKPLYKSHLFQISFNAHHSDSIKLSS